MVAPIFLYPSLTDDLKEDIFHAKKYEFSYTLKNGQEYGLDCEEAEIGSYVNCLKTDGRWNADKNNLYIRRVFSLKNYRKLFGANGLVCRNARLGISFVWTSSDSRQRGAEPILTFGVDESQFAEKRDHTFEEGEIEYEFPQGKIRGDIVFETVLYIAKSGIPNDKEKHLANEEGFVLGIFDSFALRIDGAGSIFPVFEVHENGQPLWHVRCDWTDPVLDSFSDSVSININTAHKNYKYIDRTQKTFCPQLFIEVMSSAMCCIIEKIRSEKYLDQILGDDEMESGSVGEAIRYFSNTLGWDLSSPEKLSLSVRSFFDGKVTD